MEGERWSRGTGSGGIGVSGHQNAFKDGVLIGVCWDKIWGIWYLQEGQPSTCNPCIVSAYQSEDRPMSKCVLALPECSQLC